MSGPEVSIFVYGDSISLPRSADGIRVRDTYAVKLASHIRETWSAEVTLQNRSRPAVTIKDIEYLVRADAAYFDRSEISICIVQCGIVDCAPRPLPQWLRNWIGTTWEPFRNVVIKLLHEWRPRLTGKRFYRVSDPDVFGRSYANIIRAAAANHDITILINIPPTLRNIEMRSPHLANSIYLYNAIIEEQFHANRRENVELFDANNAVGSSYDTTKECINDRDGHHLTCNGHILYYEKLAHILTLWKRRNATTERHTQSIPSADTKTPQRLLLVPCHIGHVEELVRFAEAVARPGICEPWFFVGAAPSVATEWAAIISNAGYKVYSRPRFRAPPPSHPLPPARNERWAQRQALAARWKAIGGRSYRGIALIFALMAVYRDQAPRWLLFHLFRPLRRLGRLYFPLRIPGSRLLTEWLSCHRLIREAMRTIKELRPGAVVFCENNVEMVTPLWLRAANNSRVPSFIVPYTIASEREVFESYSDVGHLGVSASFANALIMKIAPEWVASYHGRKFLRAPAERALALKLSRCSPPNPWLITSGPFTKIAAESEAMVAHYQRCGVNSAQIALTGSLADDLIYQTMSRRAFVRNSLEQELALSPGRAIIVCAFPPNQFPSRKLSSFRDYHDLWRGYLEAFRRVSGWNIVIRLHPRTRRADLPDVSPSYVTFCDWPTAKLIAIADLYVASVSATIRWAIGCGTPVINYDVFGYGYADYENLPAVFTTRCFETFCTRLEQLTSDRQFYSDAVKQQRKEAPRWAMLDGHSGERISSLVSGTKTGDTGLSAGSHTFSK